MRLRKSAYIVIASTLLAGLLAGCGTTEHTEAGNAGTEVYTDKAALGETTPYADGATIPAGETTEETTRPVNDDGTASESKETAGVAVNSQETEPFKAAEAADETHEPGSADVRPAGNNPVTEQTKPVQSESKPATVPVPTAIQPVEPKPTVAPTQPVTVNPTTTQPKPTEATKPTTAPAQPVTVNPTMAQPKPTESPKPTVPPTQPNTQPTQKPTAAPTQPTVTELDAQSTEEQPAVSEPKSIYEYPYDIEAIKKDLIARAEARGEGWNHNPSANLDNSSWITGTSIFSDDKPGRAESRLKEWFDYECEVYSETLLLGEPVKTFNIYIEEFEEGSYSFIFVVG